MNIIGSELSVLWYIVAEFAIAEYGEFRNGRAAQKINSNHFSNG